MNEESTSARKASTRAAKDKKTQQPLLQSKDGQLGLDLGKTASETILDSQQYKAMSPENAESVFTALENYKSKAQKNSQLLDSNRMIVMSNAFVISVEAGTSLAARLLRLAIGAIPANAEELPETKITTTDFSALNLTAQRLTGHARKVLEDILSYRIILVSMDKLQQGTQKLTGINVFSYATLIPGEGAINVQLNPVLKEHFLALRSNFTQYKLREICHLNTYAAIKLHELLLSYVRKYDNHLVRFNLATLSALLGYKPKKAFKGSTFFNTTLKRALEEINEHTSIEVRAVPVYPAKSRAYTDVRFYAEVFDSITEKQEHQAWVESLRNGNDSEKRKIITDIDADIETKLRTGEGELCPEDIHDRSDNKKRLPGR